MLSSPNDMQPNSNASLTTTGAHYINYAETGFFSGIVLDYLQGNERIAPFYHYPPTITGIEKAIDDRKQFNYDRKTLVAVLKQQYSGIALTPRVAANIDLLLQENTYTVTTAHQPNIFTGPLYFIYKIIHAIKLAASLSRELAGNSFVPVYYMGSEDADLDELGHFTVDGKRYEWKTKQTGAVGRMKIDKNFLLLLSELESQLSVLPHGGEMISIFKNAYKEGESLQQCTLRLVNDLFGKFGLVVLVPDSQALKKVFIPVVQRELSSRFSHKAVEETIADLGKHYKVQAGGRELNLFYLFEDKRERIEIEENKFLVRSLNLSFSEQEILEELETYPDRFSPNVILRGVFQETILPNVAFIGGGGELAYWLELKKVFDESGVPLPVLVLRNSFLVMNSKQMANLNELGFAIKDLFSSKDSLMNDLVARESSSQLSLTEEKGELNSFYQQLHESVFKIDASLAEHVAALQAKALKRIEELEKKMLRSEKKKFEKERKRIEKLKSSLFPGNNLQERVENISGFYARTGEDFIRNIYEHSLALEQQFCLVVA
jgi:bacillithiol biosynthesis cysteine-adding enzyme BshC